MPFEAVIFDIGDTLIDTAGRMKRSVEMASEQLHRRGYIGSSADFISAWTLEDEGADYQHVNHLFSDLTIVRRALRCVNAEDTVLNNAAELFLVHYRNALRETLEPINDTTRLLGAVRTQGLRLAAISNGTTKHQLEVLVRMQILDYFEVVIISESVGVEKPDPRIFTITMDALGLPAARCLVIGDDARADVQGALNVGAAAALATWYVDSVAREQHPQFPVFKSREEVLKFLSED